MNGANLQTPPLHYLIGTTKCTKVHEKGLCGLSLCVSASLREIKSNTPIRVHSIFVTFRVFRGY